MSTTKEWRDGRFELAEAERAPEPINGSTERPTTPPEDWAPPPPDHCSECGRELDSYEGACEGCDNAKLYCSDCMLYADEGCCSVDCLRKVVRESQAETKAMKSYYRDVHVALASEDLPLAAKTFYKHCGPFATTTRRRPMPESAELAMDALSVAYRCWRELDESRRLRSTAQELKLRSAMRMVEDRAAWVAEMVCAGHANDLAGRR